MIASFCMTLSCGHGISTTAGAVRRCHFFILFILPDKSRDVLEGYGGFLRRFPTMSQSPAAALLRAAKTPPGSWLDLDLLKIYYGESSSCPWPLRIRGSAVWDARGPGVDRRPPDFFFQWQRWQAVNSENAISFVVNYQPTQSDTRLRIHQDVLTSSPSCQWKTARSNTVLLLPTCDSKEETKQNPPLTFWLWHLAHPSCLEP